MMNSEEQWWVNTFDDVVEELSVQDGVQVSQSKGLVVQRFVEAVREGAIPQPRVPSIEEIGFQRFQRFIPKQRTKRREHMVENLDYILDAIKDPSVGMTISDPMLKFAFPLGTSDGKDRSLGLWTIEDYDRSALRRYRNAADVTVAAKEFDERQQSIVNLMHERSAQFTRELFDEENDATTLLY